MKNLSYILLDYAKIKKSQRIKRSKLRIGIVVILISACILAISFAVMSVVMNKFKLFMGVTLILIPIYLLARNLDPDPKYFSMFGTLKNLEVGDDIKKKVEEANKKRNEDGEMLKCIKGIRKKYNCYFIKSIVNKIEEILQEDAELMREQSNEMADAVPEWFEYFLGEKGVNPDNIGLLIDELSVKYDYPVIKSAWKAIDWILIFIGIDYIKEIPWLPNWFFILAFFVTIIICIVYFWESNRFFEKSSLHPLLHIKKNKEELLYDLKLMKIKWDSQKKESANKPGE